MDSMKLDSFIKQSIVAIKDGASDASNSQSAIEVEFDLCISCLDSDVQIIPTFARVWCQVLTP